MSRILHARRTWCAIAALALTACAGEVPGGGVSVTVAPESSPGAKPVFRVATTSGAPPHTFFGLSVVRCGHDTTMWTLTTPGGASTAAPPDTIVYGEAPTGYATTVGPLPLRPGCYEVFAAGASARFRVERDGRITPAR